VLLATIELISRSYGYEPMIRDSMELWCKERDRVSKEGKDSVVLLGASRMQLDLVPEVLSEYFREKNIVMLAIDGRQPMATLESLANDKAFTGTVICSLHTMWFLPESKFSEDQKQYVLFYETEWKKRCKLSFVVGTWMEEHLSLLHEGFSFYPLASRLMGNSYYNYLILTANRYRKAYYARLGSHLSEHAKIRYDITRQTYEEAFIPSPEKMAGYYKVVESAVSNMKNRGCEVVFIRLPTSGRVCELDQQYCPKSLYWDRFAEQTESETYHFRDYESLNGFECPDGSHLDYSDTICFTRSFAEILLSADGGIGNKEGNYCHVP
jgi:hypothetical protein